MSYISFSLFGGMSFSYFDFWRQNVNREIIHDSSSTNYLASLYEKGETMQIDLVKYYEMKMECVDQKLTFTDKAILKLINFEINMKMKYDLQPKYDIVREEPSQDYKKK